MGSMPFAWAAASLATWEQSAGRSPTGNAARIVPDTPFITAEMGGGMQVTYHRRPILTADDIAAMMPVMLGSGVNLYGSYMFHGGENPDGKLTTLQESLDTHFDNDLPQKTYDFQAPIGEFGDERESLLKLKLWNYFLNDFGAELAPMHPRRPDVQPASPSDFSVPRIAARTAGSSGFLFVNNHVREYPMPARDNFQVTIKLPGDKSVTLPSKPITLPADAYFVWPFNIDLSGLHLRFATAQPLAILGTIDAPVYAFVAQRGIDAEFVIDDQTGLVLDSRQSGNHLQVTKRDGAFVLRGEGEERSRETVFKFGGGKTLTILLLDEEGAEDSWKIATGEGTGFLSTPLSVYVDGDTATLQNLGDATIAYGFNDTPTIGHLVPVDPSGHELSAIELTRFFEQIRKDTPAITNLDFAQIHAASSPAPLPADFKPSTRPRVVAAAPTEADWSRAATYSIPLPKSALADTPTEQHFLRITYTGDVARLSINGHLLDDNFADGRSWLVGLDRFASQITQSGGKLDFSIYPLRPNSPIFYEPGNEPKPDTPPASLESVQLLTLYTLKLKLVPTAVQKK